MSKCSAPSVHVTHPYNKVSITSASNMRTFRLIGAVFLSYNSGPFQACPLETDPSFEFESEVSVFVDDAAVT